MIPRNDNLSMNNPMISQNNNLMNNPMMSQNNIMLNNPMMPQNNLMLNNPMMPEMNPMMQNGQNDFSLISNLFTSITVRNHQHPLLYCYQIDRQTTGTTWSCDLCKTAYNWDVPSICCTFCDFDICRACMGKFQLDDIK